MLRLDSPGRFLRELPGLSHDEYASFPSTFSLAAVCLVLLHGNDCCRIEQMSSSMSGV